MKIYENPQIVIKNCICPDVLTASTSEDVDDIGFWDDAWSIQKNS